MPDGKPMTFLRALFRLEFWGLLVTAYAGMVGSPILLSIVLCTGILFVSGLYKYVLLWPRMKRIGAQGLFWETLGFSLFNATGAASAAYLFGVFDGWVWGLIR